MNTNNLKKVFIGNISWVSVLFSWYLFNYKIGLPLLFQYHQAVIFDFLKKKKFLQVPVPALKEQIASVTGVLSEQQRLICRGKVLKDDQLLSAYRILLLFCCSVEVF